MKTQRKQFMFLTFPALFLFMISIFSTFPMEVSAIEYCEYVGSPEIFINVDGYDASGGYFEVNRGDSVYFSVYTYAEPSSFNYVTFPGASYDYSGPDGGGRFYQTSPIEGPGYIYVILYQNCDSTNALPPDPAERIIYIGVREPPPPDPPATIQVRSNLDTGWFIDGPGGNDFYGNGTTAEYSGEAGEYYFAPDDLGGFSKRVSPANVQWVGSNQLIYFEVYYERDVVVNPDLSCAPLDQPAWTGDTVTFTAYGGDGYYSWYAPDGAPSSGWGNSFSVSYSSGGRKDITVTSGGDTAVCRADVSAVLVIPAPPSCTGALPESSRTSELGGGFYIYAYGVENATSVFFPTWSSVRGQDDLIWYPGEYLGGNTWRTTVDLGAHRRGDPDYGYFNSHIYMNNDSYRDVFCGTADFHRDRIDPFDYSLSSSGYLSVQKSNSNVYAYSTVTKYLLSGQSESVTLTLSGVPSGVSYSIDQGSCAPGCTSTISFAVSPWASVGDHLITVTGSPLGKTTSFILSIKDLPYYTLNVSVASGSGTITGGGISCPGTCSRSFPSGTSVTLTANPSKGYLLSPWGGVCGGVTGSQCNLVMDGNYLATANFRYPPFDYSLSNSGPSSVNKNSSNVYTNNIVTKNLISPQTEPVTLALSGVPSGVSYSIAQGNCRPDCTSTITFTIPPSAPIGDYPVTVTGSPLGKTTSFILSIKGSPSSVSCRADPVSTFVGRSVRWSGTVTGGIPPFTYAWSGTNIPTNPAPSANPYAKSYSTIGPKTAQLRVTDVDGLSSSCPPVTVQINFDPDFEEF